jgi:hypothetical protein
MKTIEQVSHKLFINWLDVLPITYDDSIKEKDIISERIKNDNLSYDFRLTKLYEKTKTNFINKKLKIVNPYDIYKIDIDNLGGLPVSEIYDTIVNDFFETIKNIKWMIYDVRCFTYVIPLIILIHLILDFDKLIKLDNTYEMLDDLDKEYDSLLAISKDFQKKYNNEYIVHENTKAKLNIQIGKKRTWIKIAAASLTANIGLIYILTR